MRLAWPGILAASIYIFMTAFAAFDVPAIIGWGNRIFTFTTYLYLLLNPQDVLPKYGLAAALSTVAMAIAAVMSFWYGRMQARSRRFAVVTGTPIGRRSSGSGAASTQRGCSSAAICAELLPILLLIWARCCRSSSCRRDARSRSCRSTTASLLGRSCSRRLAIRSTCVLVRRGPLRCAGLLLVVLRSRVRSRGAFGFIAFRTPCLDRFGVGAFS